LKTIIKKYQIIEVFLITFLIASSQIILSFSYDAYTMAFENKKMAFVNKIPEIAEKFIGIPYGYGGDFSKSELIDNSHLFYLIYDESAKKVGLKWKGYMPMDELFKQSIEVQRINLRNGDLVFLHNGHAAMIYKFKGYNNFNLIYSSLKRKQVITFHCKNVGFRIYWLKNLKGFYRPTEILLEE
jgi:hypothetical protein